MANLLVNAMRRVPTLGLGFSVVFGLAGCGGGDKGAHPADASTDASSEGGALEAGADAATTPDSATAVDAGTLPEAGRDAAAGDSATAGGDGGLADAAAGDAKSDAALPGSDADLPDGAAPSCPIHEAVLTPHAVRNHSFSGTDAEYAALAAKTCASRTDCLNPCVSAGGDSTICDDFVECDLIDSVCQPPNYWRNALAALTKETSATTDDAAFQNVDSRFADALELTDFRAAIPLGSTIRGLRLDVIRGADVDVVVDSTVRLLRGSTTGSNAVGDNRAKTAVKWPGTFASTSYGGPDDLWGATWSSTTVNAAGFGVSIAPKYTATVDTANAYIESVVLRVSYTTEACD